jgi:uncharacterized protein YegL
MGTDGVVGEVLPMYFVGDVSWSMDGDPIDALNQALGGMLDGVAESPAIGERVRFGIVTFSDTAASVFDLAELSDDMILPTLVCQGSGTSYTAVFRELLHLIPADVQMLKSQGLVVKRPTVFFLSDGEPTVEQSTWQAALRDLHAKSFRERPNMLSFGIGDADPDVIRQVATSPEYAWIAADGASTARAISEFGKALLVSMSKSADALARGEDTTYVPEPEGFVSLKSDTL